MLKAITTFYNPVGWKARLYNFHAFVRGMKEQGVPLVVVECACGDDAWQLEESGDYELVQMRSPDVIWQKERLFNLATRMQPDDVEAVALIDADIIFEDGEWAEKSLEHVRAGSSCVMPWSHAHLQQIDELKEPASFERKDKVSSGWLYAQEGEGGLSNLGGKDGHPGFATVFRRDIVEEVGLYEKHMIGGGDSVIILGTIGRTRDKFYRRIGERFEQDIEAWAARWGRFARERSNDRPLWGIEGRVCHLFHGTMGDRRYNTRYDGLEWDIDPSKLVADEGMPMRFADDVPTAERDAVFRYLRSRNEDVSVFSTYEKLGADMIGEVVVPPGGGWFDPTNEARSPNLNRLSARRSERTGEEFSEARKAIKMATAKRHPEFFAGQDPVLARWLKQQDDSSLPDQQA